MAVDVVSLLFRKAGDQVEERGVQLPAYVMSTLAASGAGGVSVDPDSSMRHDMVWSCRTKIAQDVSMFPVDVVRYVDGERREVSPTPQIIAAPSANMSSLDWRYQVVDSWLGWGNAWGIVTQRSGMFASRIELQHPTSVRWQDTDGELQFFVNEVREYLWPVGRLWHVPAYTVPGSIIGLSPIAFHAYKIGSGLAAERFGGDFFRDGGHPSAVLAVPGTPTKEQADSLKARLLQITRGNREPIVLPADTTYTPIQVSPTDSQFIDAQRYTAEQICRIFGEHPGDHGLSISSSTLEYQNRLDADIARIKRRQFWITKLQDALTELLPRPQVVKLNVDATLMMTPLERHQLHKLRLDSKTTTINRVLRVEDEPSFDGDEYDQPGIPGPSDKAQSLSVAEAVQKVYLGVGTVLTSDEARLIVNEAGGALDVPGPPLPGGSPA